MKKTVMTLLALFCLLSAARNSLARHCDLVGWSKDETRVLLWCQQGCSKDSCLPFERLEILSQTGVEKSFEILESGKSPDLSPADQAALSRTARMESALAELRAQGFSIPDFPYQRFSSGRTDPQQAQSPHVFPLTGATHAFGEKNSCNDWSGLIGRNSTFVVPFALPCKPNGADMQSGQLNLVVDQCQPDANQQANLHFSVKVEAKGRSFMAGDLSARFGASPRPMVPGEKIDMSHAFSPQRHAVMIQVIWQNPEAFYTSESLLLLDRLLTDKIFSLCLPLPPPPPATPPAEAKPSPFAQKLSQYFRMPDVSFGGHMLSGGVVATGKPGASLSGFDFVLFFNDNPVVGCGLAFGVFSYQIWNQGNADNKGWALLDLGPAVRVGRLILQSKVSLISFDSDNHWMPGIQNRLMFPLVAGQEWPFWSSLIPVPTVGYDLWFDDRLRLDHHGLFLGFSFFGNFTERTPMDGHKK